MSIAGRCTCDSSCPLLISLRRFISSFIAFISVWTASRPIPYVIFFIAFKFAASCCSRAASVYIAKRCSVLRGASDGSDGLDGLDTGFCLACLSLRSFDEETHPGRSLGLRPPITSTVAIKMSVKVSVTRMIEFEYLGRDLYIRYRFLEYVCIGTIGVEA